jgi:hypothetical protein
MSSIPDGPLGDLQGLELAHVAPRVLAVLQAAYSTAMEALVLTDPYGSSVLGAKESTGGPERWLVVTTTEGNSWFRDWQGTEEDAVLRMRELARLTAQSLDE